jgi:hypothetical protein
MRNRDQCAQLLDGAALRAPPIGTGINWLVSC